MAGTYVDITLEDFDSLLVPLYFSRVEVRGNEYVYERKFKDVEAKVEVYSSITRSGSRSGSSRSKGKDAIRVVVKYLQNSKWIPIKKQRRVYRVRNWRHNLVQRIEEARLNIYPRPCPVCGAALILREGAFGEFYSCSMWPLTKCNGKAFIKQEDI